MKRFLCLLLCLVMATALLAGCGEDDEDKGAIIPVYLASPIGNFDPAYATHDVNGNIFLGLMFEGLFRIGENGKLEKAIAKSWTIKEDPDHDDYVMEIELNTTYWSDGRQVSADDFVYAWKRLLEPEYQSENASLLFDIKNARAVKDGDMTIDDLGLYAADTTVLQIVFERKIDYNQFLENTASLALLPLREDTAVRLENWASNNATMVTNGPFILKKIEYAADQKTISRIECERNVYYYRDVDRDHLKKSVFPYRFVMDFTKTAEEQAAMYEAGEIYVDANLPLSARAGANAETGSTMSTATIVFNNNKAPFDKPEVRKALSQAIDRTALANIVVFAEAAEGFVPKGTFETTQGTSFRSAGAVLNTAGDVAGAKSLLSSAGVSSGTIDLAIRSGDHVYQAVAEYVKGVWEQLGFTVNIVEFGQKYYIENEYDQWRDIFESVYRSGEFSYTFTEVDSNGNEKSETFACDAMLVDYYSSTNPFSILSSFSRPFSGGAMDLTSGSEYANVPHVCGYVSDSYDQLIENAYAETDRAARASILHQAEQALAADMPVAPLFTYKLGYQISGELSKVKTTGDGFFVLTKAALKNYLELQTTETAATLDPNETAAG